MSAPPEKLNALEKAVAALGALVLVAVLALLVRDLAQGADAPPDLRVALGAPETRGGALHVPVTVENVGGQTAEEVTVEVCAGPETCADLTFPFLPRGSSRQGRVGFRAPLEGPLEAHVSSYRMP